MTNMEKAKEMMEKDPELMEKVNAEVERLVNAKEGSSLEEAMAKAIKTVLDIDVAEEELKESRKMNLDELDDVAGGSEGYGEYGESLGEYVFRKAVVGTAKVLMKPLCFIGVHDWDDEIEYGDDSAAWYYRTCLACGKKEKRWSGT